MFGATSLSDVSDSALISPYDRRYTEALLVCDFGCCVTLGIAGESMKIKLLICIALSVAGMAHGGEGIEWPCTGKIKLRSAAEIRASNWSVGAETMDRDYTIYENWKQYLGPLGFKKARIQAGWAKTEKQKGQYDWKWLDEIITDMVAQGKLDLIDEVTYHPYSYNPDSSYAAVEKLRQAVHAYGSRIRLRQGENGAPSERRKARALSKHDWTELSQAKWALRRLLGDLGRDIPSSYFSIMDMKYPDEMNSKGLLKANDDKTVAYVKPAYHALANLACVFDDRLSRIDGYKHQTTCLESLSLFAYESKDSGKQVVTVWFDAKIPSDSHEKTPVDFVFEQGDFDNPVYVDLREGRVYNIPPKKWSKEGKKWFFHDIPCYDSPILIADKDLLFLDALGEPAGP